MTTLTYIHFHQKVKVETKWKSGANWTKSSWKLHWMFTKIFENTSKVQKQEGAFEFRKPAAVPAESCSVISPLFVTFLSWIGYHKCDHHQQRIKEVICVAAFNLHFNAAAQIQSSLMKLGSLSVLICGDTKTCSLNTEDQKKILKLHRDKTQRKTRLIADGCLTFFQFVWRKQSSVCSLLGTMIFFQH